MKSVLTEVRHEVVGWWGISEVCYRFFSPIHPHFIAVLNLHETDTWRHMHASLLHQTPERISPGLQGITYLPVNYPSIHHPSSILIHSAASPFIRVTFFALWMLCSFCYVVCEILLQKKKEKKKSHKQTGWDLCLFTFHFLLIPFYIFIPVLNALLFFSSNPTLHDLKSLNLLFFGVFFLLWWSHFKHTPIYSIKLIYWP